MTGTAGNDTINAVSADGATLNFTSLDSIDGGAGTDTLRFLGTGAINTVTGISGTAVTGVEAASFRSAGGAITTNTTKWTGLETVTTENTGAAQTITSAATTNVTASALAVAGNDVVVNGGKDVTITSTGATTSEINALGVSGAVNVTFGGSFANSQNATIGDAVNGAVTVTGGTSVTVTQTSGASAATKDATTNYTVTQGKVTVTGGASTTSVSVTQDAAATAAAGAGSTGVIGVVAGAVDVLDANRASTTAAGTISTVSLTNFGVATINSGALTSLTLAGKGGEVGAGTLGALTTPANSTLALNLNGVTIANANGVAIDTDITTLNVAGSTSTSTLSLLDAAGVTALNVSGDKAVVLTTQTIAATAVVTVTNTAGVTLGTALATGSQFTGGAGADTITLTANFTKAHNLGDGNDTVTYAAQGTGGSVNFGDGSADTIIMTSAQAATADDSATFNSKFTNFEVLRLSDALGAGTTLDLDGLGGVSSVILAAGGANATTSILNQVKSGSTIDIRAASTGVTAQVTGSLIGTADVLNVKLTNSTNATVAYGSVTAANVETINISTVDTGTGNNAAATVDTATLVATGATTITVSGNNGLNLTNTGNTAVTSFNASGVVGDSAATVDTSANLAVTFTSANTTATATVTITGGAGNDVLTGNAAKDTIIGGAGNDTIDGAGGVDTLDGGAGNDRITGGTGADNITVGAGRDTIAIFTNSDAQVLSSDSTTAAFDTVTGFVLAGAVTTAADLSSEANFRASTAIGANVSALYIDATADDAGAGTGSNLALSVVADATGNGQAAGVTFTVSKGIITLGGSGASGVDTLGEWLTEVQAVASTAGKMLAFEFGGSTYVFGENGAYDVLTKLDGITGAGALVELSNATTNVANTIYYFDI